MYVLVVDVKGWPPRIFLSFFLFFSCPAYKASVTHISSRMGYLLTFLFFLHSIPIHGGFLDTFFFFFGGTDRAAGPTSVSFFFPFFPSRPGSGRALVVCPVFFFFSQCQRVLFLFYFLGLLGKQQHKKKGGGLPLTKLSSNQVTKRQPLLSCIKL